MEPRADCALAANEPSRMVDTEALPLILVRARTASEIRRAPWLAAIHCLTLWFILLLYVMGRSAPCSGPIIQRRVSRNVITLEHAFWLLLSGPGNRKAFCPLTQVSALSDYQVVGLGCCVTSERAVSVVSITTKL